MEISTPYGPAIVEIDKVPDPRLLLVLTHGSGGGVAAPDLLAVRDAVLAWGATVARVTQPFRVAG
ncbi:MAG TPA: alpha/beta hydrolase, partial [Thermopolyspora sp.]